MSWEAIPPVLVGIPIGLYGLMSRAMASAQNRRSPYARESRATRRTSLDAIRKLRRGHSGSPFFSLLERLVGT
jgi:hypothetical protein